MVGQQISIQAYDDSCLNEVLDLIRRSDNTDRTVQTWIGNHMAGVLARDGSRLIGAIPLEPRQIVLKHELLDVLWVSGAHVDPEYRSQGIGAKLDRLIRNTFFPKYKALCVYREDENSPAFRWYSRLGFHVLLPILAFKRYVAADSGNCVSRYLVQEDVSSIEAELASCYFRNFGGLCGSPNRYKGYWSQRIKSHYYRNHYQYSLVFIPDKGEIKSYAILGRTSIRDGIDRLDILEYCSPSRPEDIEELFRCIDNNAKEMGIKEIRIQLSIQDPIINWIQKSGFKLRWRTNLMGTMINPAGYIQGSMNPALRQLVDIGITIETPACGKLVFGKENYDISLFMSDRELNLLLFGRIDILNAVDEGRIVICDLRNKGTLDMIHESLSKQNWIYHQIDYV